MDKRNNNNNNNNNNNGCSLTRVRPTPHIPEWSAEEMDPTWTSKYLKMEPIEHNGTHYYSAILIR